MKEVQSVLVWLGPIGISALASAFFVFVAVLIRFWVRRTIDEMIDERNLEFELRSRNITDRRVDDLEAIYVLKSDFNSFANLTRESCAESYAESLASIRTVLMEELRAEILHARRTGIPIQVVVASRAEAELFRQTIGVGTIRVSRRVQVEPTEGTAPALPSPAGGSVWDRLTADEPTAESTEAPCPPQTPPAKPRKTRKRF